MSFEESLKKEYILDLAEYLIKKGFKPKEAYKLSENFWKKNWKKLKKVF